MTFPIPSCLEDGEYLMRVEHLALHQAKTNPEFFLTCAQVAVSGGSGGPATGADPDELVAFPGAYEATEPGIRLDIRNNPETPHPEFPEYQPPGPAPITC